MGRHKKPEPERAYAPHCDPSILHAPGKCPYCDHYPDFQAYREVAQINFTGEPLPDGKCPCPSEWFRDALIRDMWPGNRPEGYGA